MCGFTAEKLGELGESKDSESVKGIGEEGLIL